jgi:hypothetical protein
VLEDRKGLQVIKLLKLQVPTSTKSLTPVIHTGTQILAARRGHHLTGGTNVDEKDIRERGENTCTSESQPQSAI